MTRLSIIIMTVAVAVGCLVGCVANRDPGEPISVDNVEAVVELTPIAPGVSEGIYGDQSVTFAQDVRLLPEELRRQVASSGEDITGPLVVTAGLVAGPQCSGGGSTCSCANGCVCIATDRGCACGCGGGGPATPPHAE